MQTLPPTPISDPNITPFLADIISHINDEHTHDLRTIAEAKLGGLSQQITVSFGAVNTMRYIFSVTKNPCRKVNFRSSV